MAFDLKNPQLRDSEIRKGEFRETGRDIVWKDRSAKKARRPADTGGAITRALEAAYRLGLAHGQASPEDAKLAKVVAGPDDAMDWLSIPPKPRTAFKEIVDLNLIVILQASLPLAERWACYFTPRPGSTKEVEPISTYSPRTLAPLERLGLMAPLELSGKTVLRITSKGAATVEKAVREGKVRMMRQGKADNSQPASERQAAANPVSKG